MGHSNDRSPFPALRDLQSLLPKMAVTRSAARAAAARAAAARAALPDAALPDASLAKALARIAELERRLRLLAEPFKAKASADGPKKTIVGAAAYVAFMKHVKVTMPERFKGITSAKDNATMVRAIRAEDPARYETFINQYKASTLAKAAALAEAAEAEDERCEAAAKRAEKRVATRNAAQEDEDPSWKKLVLDNGEFMLDAEDNKLYELRYDGSVGNLVGMYHPAINVYELFEEPSN